MKCIIIMLVIYVDNVLSDYKSLHAYMNITPCLLGLELSHTSSRRGDFRIIHLKPLSEAMTDNFCFRNPREWDSLPDTAV